MGISKWNAGIVRPVPVAPAGPYADSSAPGVWTIDQQAYWQKQGLWPTQGNVNPDLFIENLFSTYLYTGNDGTLPIVNGIDLATYGGMTWLKSRTYGGGGNHQITDTARGINAIIKPNLTDATSTASGDNLVSFNTTGFTLGSGFSGYSNFSGSNNVVWTFREQPKFFDVVTYTGTGVAGLTVPHNLGSVPGCIIVKNITDGSADWAVYHRSIGNTGGLTLNNTNATTTGSAYWNNTSPTSTQFTLGSFTRTNVAGQSFVAYLFAHDAGGFGLTGTDNVISCGSFTQGAGDTAITLGYEPQWVMIKSTDATGSSWAITDNMRAMPVSGQASKVLNANLSNAESSSIYGVHATATGFISNGFTSGEFIYIAIRRGPMAVPTLGTSVFSPVTRTGTGATATGTAGFAPDLVIPVNRPHDYTGATPWFDKLRGVNQALYSNTTGAEENRADTFVFSNTGVIFGTNAIANSSSASYINWYFRRAPGFFDEVCYTGTGSATTFNHNLTVVPEMMIVKRRSASADWPVYHVAMGPTKYTFLDGSTELTGTMWNNTTPTSSVFSVDGSYYVNNAANTYVAYLFATCPGVSKVGSYTGTGALQTVACGFTSGARFVLIHRIDSGSNSWYVWDSARGITSGNDPYLQINNTAAEVTGTNYVDTDTTGFKVTAAAPAALNAVGGNYIFLAIA